jgi:hypothetical protein
MGILSTKFNSTADNQEKWIKLEDLLKNIKDITEPNNIKRFSLASNASKRGLAVCVFS